MGRVNNMEEVAVNDLRPYERNAKLHPRDQIEKLKRSIEEFGFLSPCLIDREGNIIAGHGRVEAAKELGLETVPCVYVEGLTDEQRRAYILADNRLTELGGWDMNALEIELGSFEEIDIDLTGFTIRDEHGDWFSSGDKGEATEEDSDKYRAFVEKFEAKHTTDDCYTPPAIYDVIAEWVAKEYNLNKANFVRPFYPNGDYQREKYKDSDIVVDNPPFSILAEIVRFYSERGIRFFLFAPFQTCMHYITKGATAIPICASIEYENGANVLTSFLTNLEPEDVAVRTDVDLYSAIMEANAKIHAEKVRTIPKYKYPDHILTAAMAGKFAKYGQPLTILKKSAVVVDALDEQKEQGKVIFGRGLLLSEKAAAEKAAAEKAAAEKAAAEKAAAEKAAAEKAAAETWNLSPREWEIVKGLD